MTFLSQNKRFCGIKIGSIQASYPFTIISVEKTALNIKSLLGSYYFRDHDIVSIHSKTSWIGQRYTLTHLRRDYPREIQILFVGQDGERFFTSAEEIGFKPKGDRTQIPIPQSPIIFDLTRLFKYLVLMMKARFILPPVSFCVFGILTCFFLEICKSWQTFFLLPNRHYGEIQHLNRLTLVVWLILLILMCNLPS